MEVTQVIFNRHSCRAFKPDPVPEALIKEILDLARHSPSYMNSQPWEIAVITGEKLAEVNKKRVEIASANTPPRADVSLPSAWSDNHRERIRRFQSQRRAALMEGGGTEKEWDLNNCQFFGAPCALFLFIDRILVEWSIFDAGLFTQTLLLAAQDKGLSSCIQASVVRYPDEVRKILGIPDTKKLIIGIALGYPDTSAEINKWRSDRSDVGEFTKWYS